MNDLIGLLILAATSLLPITAYRSNLKLDASWEGMRRELTPTTYLGRAGATRTFYSKRFVDALVPVLENLKTFQVGQYGAYALTSDVGYTHMMINSDGTKILK